MAATLRCGGVAPKNQRPMNFYRFTDIARGTGANAEPANVGARCPEAVRLKCGNFTPSDLERIGEACLSNEWIIIGQIGNVWTSEDKTLGRHKKSIRNSSAKFRPYFAIGCHQVFTIRSHHDESLEVKIERKWHGAPSVGNTLKSMTAEEIFETCKGRRIRKHAKKLTHPSVSPTAYAWSESK